MKYFIVFLGLILMGGCVTRTYTTETPRVDTDIQGNQGFLLGTPKEECQKPKKLSGNRITSVLEVELGAHPRKKAQKQVLVNPVEEAVIEEEEVEFVEEVPAAETVTSEKKYESYTIQKDDTLQKISEKFYGTTKKWQMLYNENKDVLKSPNSLRPGKTIKIPVLDK
ncbi:MAG: LysM peptidoglycan-binding domain-containing protein [Candidatus Omnitrophota bacterium]|jgi:nucleoid-associated protein YgaU